ncbi:hypothetical protein ACFW2D_09530 [Streptomyces sp. NPDC058914]|uniref:hypothetical protein n=1 Tax=Streptomyces sp. NPDC058914 TaxID=3346671 RepID=UPI0036D1EEE1
MHDDQLHGSPPGGDPDLPAARAATGCSGPPPLFEVRVEENREGLADLARQAAEDTQARVAEDVALYEALVDAEFGGVAWELFAEALAAYAFPVVTSWLYTGEIFGRCAARGRPARARRTRQDMEALRAEPDEREGLACEVVAQALHVFRKRALAKGGWRPDGGASLKTYFMGAVLGEFAAVYDRWASERARSAAAHPYGTEALRDVPARAGEEPETRAIGHDAVRRLLAEVKDDTTRTALFLWMEGYAMKEIGEHLHLSATAVAMRLSRLRRNPPRQGGREGS